MSVIKLSQIDDEIGTPVSTNVIVPPKVKSKRTPKSKEEVVTGGAGNDRDIISTIGQEDQQVELTYPNIKNIWTDKATLQDLKSPDVNSKTSIKPISSPEGTDPNRLVAICNELFLFPTPQEYFENSINTGLSTHSKHEPIAADLLNIINSKQELDINYFNNLINTTYSYIPALIKNVTGESSDQLWQTEVPNEYLKVSNWIIAKNRVPEIGYDLQKISEIWGSIYNSADNFSLNNVRVVQSVYERMSALYNELLNAVQNNQSLPTQQQLNNIILKGIPQKPIPIEYKSKSILRDIPRTEATFTKFIQQFIKERTHLGKDKKGNIILKINPDYKTLPLSIPGVGTVGPDSIKNFFESGENLSNFNSIKNKINELNTGISEGRYTDEELPNVLRSIHNIIWRQFGETSVSGDIVTKTRKIQNPLIGELYPSVINAGKKLMSKLGVPEPGEGATREEKSQYLTDMANNSKIIQAIFEYNKAKLINASQGLISNSDDDVIENLTDTANSYDEDDEIEGSSEEDVISDVGGTAGEYIPKAKSGDVTVKNQPDGSLTYYLQDKKGKETLLYNTKDLVSTVLLAPAIQKAINISAQALPKPEVNENNKNRGEGLYTSADLIQLGFMAALTTVGKYNEDSGKSLVGTVMNRVKSVCRNYINRSLKGLDEKSTRLSRLVDSYSKRYGGSQKNYSNEEVTKYVKDCLISETQAKASLSILYNIKKEGIDENSINEIQNFLNNFVVNNDSFSYFSKKDGVNPENYKTIANNYVNSIINYLKGSNNKAPRLEFTAQDNFIAYDINTATFEALNSYLTEKGSNLGNETLSKSEQSYLNNTTKDVSRIQDITSDDITKSIEMSRKQTPTNLGSVVGEGVDEVDLDALGLLDAFTGEGESASPEKLLEDEQTLEKYSENYDAEFSILNRNVLRNYEIVYNKTIEEDAASENNQDLGILITDFKSGKFNNKISVDLNDFFRLLFGYYGGLDNAKSKYAYVVNYANSIYSKTVNNFKFPESIDKKYKELFQYIVLKSFKDAGSSKDIQNGWGNSGQIWNAVKVVDSVDETNKVLNKNKPKKLTDIVKEFEMPNAKGVKPAYSSALQYLDPKTRSDILLAISMKATDDVEAGKLTPLVYQHIMMIINYIRGDGDGVYPSTVRADSRTSYMQSSPLGQAGLPPETIGKLSRGYISPLVELLIKSEVKGNVSRV